MSQGIIAGLDVATVTGWCIPYREGQGEWDVLTGEWDFTPKPPAPTKGRGVEPDGLRYYKAFQAVSRLLKDNPRIVGFVIEQPYSQGYKQAQVLGGLIAAVEIACHVHDVEYVFVNASTLKAWARGIGIKEKGTMKEGMRLEAVRILGRGLTDNEADAYWLTRWARENLE